MQKQKDCCMGVIVDNQLSWKARINDLAPNPSKLIALIRRIKMYLPLQTTILFYKTKDRLLLYCLHGDNHHTHQEYINYKNLF
jgi:hypothetical protein